LARRSAHPTPGSYPGIPIVFADTRRHAEDWTYRFLTTALTDAAELTPAGPSRITISDPYRFFEASIRLRKFPATRSTAAS
jgi:hypothetical protein